MHRDRGRDNIGLGMAGSMQIPIAVPLDTIRREGRRLGYDGDALEEFVEIVSFIDDTYVEVETKRRSDQLAADLRRMKNRAPNG